MKRGAILAAAVLAVTSLGTIASAARAQGPGMERHGFGMEDGHHGPNGLLPPGPWWRNQQTATAIGLSADQQKKIDDIFLNARVQLIHLHATLEENQVRLDEVLNAPTFDAAKAQKLIDEGADDRASLEKADAHMLLNIRGVLTADQWTKLQAARHAHAQRGGFERGGPGQFHGRGPGAGRGPGGPPSGAPNGAPAPPPAQ